MKESTGQVLVQAPPPVANFLLNEKRAAVVEIEMRHKTHVVIVADENLETPHLEITRVRESEMGEHVKPSYERLTARKEAALPKVGQIETQGEQPAVSGVRPSSPAPQRDEEPERESIGTTAARAATSTPAHMPQSAEGGLIKRLLGWFRSAPDAAATAAPAAPGGQSRNGERTRERGPARERRTEPRSSSAARSEVRGQPVRPAQPGGKPAQPARGAQTAAKPATGSQRGSAKSAERAAKPGDPRGSDRAGNPPRTAGAGQTPPQQAASADAAAATPPSGNDGSVRDSAAPVPGAGPTPAASTSVAAVSPAAIAPGTETAEAPRSRRRGRRGGRRRRNSETTALGNAVGAGQIPRRDEDDEDGEQTPATAESRTVAAPGRPPAMAAADGPGHPASDERAAVPAVTPAVPANTALPTPAPTAPVVAGTTVTSVDTAAPALFGSTPPARPPASSHPVPAPVVPAPVVPAPPAPVTAPLPAAPTSDPATPSSVHAQPAPTPGALPPRQSSLLPEPAPAAGGETAKPVDPAP